MVFWLRDFLALQTRSALNDELEFNLSLFDEYKNSPTPDLIHLGDLPMLFSMLPRATFASSLKDAFEDFDDNEFLAATKEVASARREAKRMRKEQMMSPPAPVAATQVVSPMHWKKLWSRKHQWSRKNQWSRTKESRRMKICRSGQSWRMVEDQKDMIQFLPQLGRHFLRISIYYSKIRKVIGI